MKLYDQHVHTFLSSDSNEAFERYVKLAQKKGLTHFVSTEHLDLSCRSLGRDDVYDMAKQNALIRDLQNKYTVKILKGVELGYKFSRLQDIENIVRTENFDVVIMSVHENEEADCTSSLFSRKNDADTTYSAYLDLYLHMLQHTGSFDIVGHVDFLLRYIGTVHIETHKEKLLNIFHMLIAKEKCLEYNTRFLYAYEDSFYLEYIFRLYYSCGGRKVSLGSDAHATKDFMGAFDVALDLLKDIGFTAITTYQKRKARQIPIIS